MTFLAETLPVLGAVALALTFALLLTRSLLDLMFGALRRTRVGRESEPAAE